MSWTFAEERPICWEEPPEQIAITNVETGEHDFYVLASSATIYGMTWKEIKREVGELAHMEHEMLQARGSRDYWKAKCEGLERGICERYVKLPADANGETTRPGAMVTHAGKTWAVRTLMLTDEGEWLLDCQPEDGEPITGRTVKPEDCAVVKRRTVEDVLRDFLGAMADAADGDPHEMGDAEDAAIRRYADEIRQMLDD